MDRFLRLNMPALFRFDGKCMLAAAWIFGLISGAAFSVCSDDSIFSLMRMASSSHVSIFGLISVILLPLLFSAFAVYFSQHWLLIPIAFCKAFLFSYVGFGVMYAYESAGWLIRLLLMFSDVALLPLLYLFWSFHLNGKRRLSPNVTTLLLSLGGAIGCIDYYIISPFLAKVLSL